MPEEESTNFDAVLMNHPYSAKWGTTDVFYKVLGFSKYGVLALKPKVDFAFFVVFII